MKRLTVLLAAVLFVFACTSHEKVTETTTFNVADDFTSISIDLPAGSVDINSTGNTSDGTGIELIVETFAWGGNESAAHDNLDRIEVEQFLDGDTYRIIVHNPNDPFEGNRDFAGGANLTFNNARDKNIIINSGAGTITCDDISGGSIQAGAGAVAIGRSQGPVDISVAAGSVSVMQAEGDFDINTAAGNIVLTAVGDGPRNGSAICATGNITLTLSENLSCNVDLAVTLGTLQVSGVFIDDLPDGEGVDIGATFTLNEGEGIISAETAVGAISVTVQ
jgi:hypothetical protein